MCRLFQRARLFLAESILLMLGTSLVLSSMIFHLHQARAVALLAGGENAGGGRQPASLG